MDTAIKIGIIPFTYFGGANKRVGSTFLRVDGLIKHGQGIELWKHGHRYDALIFQKAYWCEMMELFKGPKILDICDPDWLDGSVDIVTVGQLCDAITCSSPALTTLVKSYFPDKMVVHVPDRLDSKIFPAPKRVHVGKAKKVVWFGFIHNAFETLSQLTEIISRNNLELTIISDRPYRNNDAVLALKPKQIKYQQNSVYALIKQADIVLNPRSDRAKYRYKSNNKTLIAWKLGVPVAESADDIERLIDPAQRNNEIKLCTPLLTEFDIKKSARQYSELIRHLLKCRHASAGETTNQK